MLLLFVGLSIEAREGRNSKSTVPESLLVRSRAIRIGNPRRLVRFLRLLERVCCGGSRLDSC
jgi:hypothetical protein